MEHLRESIYRFQTKSGYEPEYLRDRYDCYRTFADDGAGGDITRGGAPLLSYEEWLAK